MKKSIFLSLSALLLLLSTTQAQTTSSPKIKAKPSNDVVIITPGTAQPISPDAPASGVVVITPDAPAAPVVKTAPPTKTALPATGAKTVITPSHATALVRQVLKETSLVRNLPIKRQVPAGVQNAAGVEKMARKALNESVTADEIMGAELLLKKLGLAPANFDLKKYYVSMMGEQLAGYYDTKERKFFTTQRVDKLQLETIMAHELTHALQDQHFDLTRLEKWPKHDSDAKIAMAALVEGDATFTMSRYAMRNPMRALGLLASSLSPANSSPVLTSGPNALKESMTFPYMQGMMFVQTLFQRDGWPAVSGAFKKLPKSTEQILHPEKYFQNEPPVRVAPIDLSSYLGKGWRRIDHDVNGEFGFTLILKEHLASPAQVARASAGWAGDRYAIYRGPRNQSLFAQVCLWDSEADAQEFFDAYSARTDIRYNVKPNSNGAAKRRWNLAEGDVMLERRGTRVVILEGLPISTNADKLAAPLWR